MKDIGAESFYEHQACLTCHKQAQRKSY